MTAGKIRAVMEWLGIAKPMSRLVIRQCARDLLPGKSPGMTPMEWGAANYVAEYMQAPDVLQEQWDAMTSDQRDLAVRSFAKGVAAMNDIMTMGDDHEA